MEVIDSTAASNSPQELAIRFLLRHAQCQGTLTAKIEGALWKLAADAQSRNATREPQEATGKDKLEAADAAAATAPNRIAPEGSFLARFSKAYAAARHLPVSKARSSRTGGSNAARSSGSASAAA